MRKKNQKLRVCMPKGQPSQIIFFFSGQLVANSLGLVTKGSFRCQNILIPCVSAKKT